MSRGPSTRRCKAAIVRDFLRSREDWTSAGDVTRKVGFPAYSTLNTIFRGGQAERKVVEGTFSYRMLPGVRESKFNFAQLIRLALADGTERTAAEIAETIGTSRGTAYMHASLSMLRLRGHVREGFRSSDRRKTFRITADGAAASERSGSSHAAGPNRKEVHLGKK